MKTQLVKFKRMRSVEHVFSKFPDEVEGKTEIQAGIGNLVTNNSRISELLSELVRPHTLIFLPRTEEQKKLRTTVKRMTGLGILIAARQQNEAKKELFRMFNRLVTRSAGWNLYNQATQVHDELMKDQEAASVVGLTEEKLSALQEMITQFGALLETTDKQLKQRKALSQELESLLASNTSLLTSQFDPFVAFEQETHPALYREYMIARKAAKSRKQSPEAELLAEISGTVTDKSSAEAINNATLLINELERVTTTDEDGYYLFDEVPVGKYTLSCSAAGYKLPDISEVIVSDSASLQIDFTLEPESATGIGE